MNWLNFAKGFKTFAGGAVLIAGGGAGMFFGVVDPGTGIGLIRTGLSVWGLGGKANDISQKIEKWATAQEKEIKIHVPKND